MRGPRPIVRSCLAALLWLAFSTLAFAHAALTGSQPADGAMLSAMPARITLSFSEPVSPLVLTLVRPDGAAIILGASGADTPSLTVTPPSDLGRGTHLLSWRVVSADGHPVGGTIAFSIGERTAAPADPAEAADLQVDTGLWASKLLLYLGIFVGIGGATTSLWFVNAAAPGRAVALISLAAGVVATPVAAGFQGLDALGAPLSNFFRPVIWATAFETSFARTLPVLASVFILAGISIVMNNGRTKQALAFTALAGAAGALAASGHAAAAQPQWLTRPAVFLHAFALALWLGALPPLGLAFMDSKEAARGALKRFSAAISPVVAVVVLSGGVLAVIQVEWPEALLVTAYGRILLIKLALVLLLLTIAAYNRWRLTAPALAGEGPARQRLAKTIAVEVVLVLVVLGLAAGWRFTPPPRALAIAAAEPATVHIHSDEAMAEVTITPGHVGPATISAIIMTGDFGPLDAQSVTFVLTPPDAAQPRLIEARKPGDGTWAAKDVDLSKSGVWRLKLDLRVDGKTLTLSDEFSVKDRF